MAGERRRERGWTGLTAGADSASQEGLSPHAPAFRRPRAHVRLGTLFRAPAMGGDDGAARLATPPRTPRTRDPSAPEEGSHAGARAPTTFAHFTRRTGPWRAPSYEAKRTDLPRRPVVATTFGRCRQAGQPTPFAVRWLTVAFHSCLNWQRHQTR